MHLDRFAYGLPDPQARPAAVVATCCCGDDIFVGDEAISHEDNLYCGYRCLMEDIGAVEVNAGMGD